MCSGYKVSEQPKCLENSFDMSDFKCVKDGRSDEPENKHKHK